MITVYRKEIKYVIPLEFFTELEHRLGAFMIRDTHGDHGTYLVRSQYYDSLTDGDLRDNLSGMMEKSKIRMRVYSPQDAVAKLEFKCKSGADGVKKSLTVTREDALRMEQHEYDFLLAREEPLAQQLYVRMTQQVYRPKTMIEYLRTAYLFSLSNVRITFDRDVRASAYPYGLFQEDLSCSPILSEDRGVLEVKYDGFLPTPLRDMLRGVDSLPEANSKYSQARMAYI